LTSASGTPIQLGSTNVNNGASLSIPLTVDSGSQALGDYTADFSFDTNVLRVTGVTGGTGEFAAAPTFNTNTPGQVVLSALNTTSLTSPTGVTLVAHISFTAIGSPGTNSLLAFNSANADDTDGSPLSTTTVNGLVSINGIPPVANFSGSPTNGLVPLIVAFTNASSGTITNSLWNFGDGNTSNTMAATLNHTYGAAGTYTVTLIANGQAGSSTNTRSSYIVAQNPASLLVNPPSLSFGTVAVGFTSNLNFAVINTGDATLSGTASSAAPFSVTSGASYNVGGGQTQTVTATFTPSSAVASTGSVFFASNGGDSTNTVTGTGAIVPVASFTGTPMTGAVSLAVTFTDSSTGTITNRFWNFGDGNTSNTLATSVAHTYNAAGTNTVSLTIFGPVGTNVQTRNNYIVVQTLPQLVVTPASRNYGSVTIGLTNTLSFSVINNGQANLSGTATSAAPFSVTGGASYNLAGSQTQTVTVAFAPSAAVTSTGSVTFASDGGVSTNTVIGNGLTPGSITVTPASQDFGTIATGTTAQLTFVVTNSGGTSVSNGTATALGAPFTVVSGASFSVPGFGTSNITVRFAPVSAGAFTNSVAFGSANGGAATNTVIGVGAIVPVASFTGTPTNGALPLAVTFTDNSTGTITNRFWDFGDGNTSNTVATSVSHTYNIAGTNTVSLTVTGPVGVNTQTRVNYIVAHNPPVANFSGSPTLGHVSLAVTFTDTSTGNVTNRFWNFGDGNTINTLATSVGHTYNAVGTNSVSLTVFGIGGSSTTNRADYIVVTNFFADVTPPQLSVDIPTEYEAFTNAGLTVSGSASDASGINGVTVNGSAASVISTNWSQSVTLSEGTNTFTVIATDASINLNTTTQTVHAVLLVNHPPQITAELVVTNALINNGTMSVVVAGDTNIFSVSATDADGNALNYEWAFGDGHGGNSSVSIVGHVYTNECGPYNASVTVSDGELSTNSTRTVVVACEMQITKMQAKLSFSKSNADSCSFTANIALPGGFNLASKTVTVSMGGAQSSFTLDAKGKGKGKNALGTCSFKYNKKTSNWTISVKLGKTNLQDEWADDGFVNATVAKPGTSVVLTTAVLIDNEAFAADKTLLYTATAGKSGSAR
jgi:PKD repeat protein